MTYHSHKNTTEITQFSDALLSSLAKNAGLWMPTMTPSFTPDQTARMGAQSFADCAAELSRYFVDDNFSPEDLNRICEDAYDYPLPMRSLRGQLLDAATPEPGTEYMLELFHGPTAAFKDFAARFMARCAAHIMQSRNERRTILVATSGDTGGAIGDAFLNQPNIRVVILYPEGGVSAVQEQQMTTIGHGEANVNAVSVKGSFDDCQLLVKHAFADAALNDKHALMSANSINVGRVIPQSFYYFWTSLQVKAANPTLPIVYAIPSGNLGNLTGGLIAKRMGAPIDRFVVGNNINAPFVNYLGSGQYQPSKSVPTLSNAMDIGRPNNFDRILSLYNAEYADIQKDCWGASFTDAETAKHMRDVYDETGYVMCPHTAIGHLAMREFESDISMDFVRVCVATAHPAKFADSVESILETKVEMPKSLQSIMKRKQKKTTIDPTLDALAAYLEK